MESILNSNYDDGDDSYTGFDQPKSSKSDLFGDGDDLDDDASSNPEGMDDQEYQDAAQEIEDNLIKDIKRERGASGSDAAGGFDDNSSNGSSSNHTGGGGNHGGGASSSTQHSELKQSSSFEQDMAFPALGRYSENERERQKRKELKTKKEIEEEEREKMQ